MKPALEKLSLTAKMVLIILGAGIFLWGVLDTALTRQTRASFKRQLTEQLGLQTTEGRQRFDKFIKSHFLLTEIIASQSSFLAYFRNLDCADAEKGGGANTDYLDPPPAWMPTRSLLRNVAQAAYFMIINAEGEAIEAYQTIDRPIPPELLSPAPTLIAASQNENFITTINGIPYVVSSREIEPDNRHSCLLLLATPIDDQLLVSIQPPYESHQIVALATGLFPSILTSSEHNRVRPGSLISDLQKEYFLENQVTFSYEVSDLLISYVHLLPHSELERLAAPVIRAQRFQNLTIFLVLIVTSLLLTVGITRRVQRLSDKVITFSKEALGKELLTDQEHGDQLSILETRYHALTNAVEERTRQLKKANAELSAAYEQLKQTQAKILQQEKMASIGQLAAGVAHEINNPMGFISSNLGSLAKYQQRIQEYLEASAEFLAAAGSAGDRESLTALRKTLKLDYIMADIPGLITESREGAERVQAIVANLKSFSRVDQDRYKKANLNECLESTLNIVWNELKYKTTVSKEYGDLPETYCSPQALNQVFMNLLINAVQAIEQQGEIRIKTWSEDGHYIFVSISDSGQGIPTGILTRIFDPFFTTKEVGKGTGLGLSICYDIVKQHDGEICVESRVGKGTTFNIVLPVKQEEELQPES